LQDVPLRPSPIPRDPKAIDDFPSVLQRVLRAVNVRPALSTMLNTDVSYVSLATPTLIHYLPLCQASRPSYALYR